MCACLTCVCVDLTGDDDRDDSRRRAHTDSDNERVRRTLFRDLSNDMREASLHGDTDAQRHARELFVDFWVCAVAHKADLPTGSCTDVWSVVLGFLTLPELLCASQVCTRLRRVFMQQRQWLVRDTTDVTKLCHDEHALLPCNVRLTSVCIRNSIYDSQAIHSRYATLIHAHRPISISCAAGWYATVVRDSRLTDADREAVTTLLFPGCICAADGSPVWPNVTHLTLGNVQLNKKRDYLRVFPSLRELTLTHQSSIDVFVREYAPEVKIIDALKPAMQRYAREHPGVH